MKDKKKIVIVEAGHLSKTSVSGGDKLIQPMLPYLKDNLDFKIIIPKIAKKHWEIKKDSNFYILPPFFLEKVPNLPAAVFLIYIWRSVFLLIYLLKIQTPYVLYSSSLEIVDWLTPFFVKLFLKKNIIWVVRIHHLKANPRLRPGNSMTNQISFVIDKIGLFCFKKADLVIVLNNNIRKQISKIVKIGKVRTLGAGIDFRKIYKFKPLAQIPAYDAVFLGRIHYTKGVLDLPIIWHYVQKSIPSAKLAIIGELSIPQLEKALRKKIIKANLQKYIEILGYQSGKSTLSILKKSKVFLFTDLEAGFGLAAAEAMAAGLPVIGWDIGILGNVFKKGYKTISLKNNRVFARMVIRILKDDKLRKTLSNQAIAEAKKFDWMQISHDFENSLKNL